MSLEPNSIIIISFFLCFIVSYLLVPVSKRIAFKLNIVDIPDSERKIHKYPIPYLGGLSIIITFLFGIVFVKRILFANFEILELPAIMLCATLMFILGLLDDKFDLNAKVKFFAQIGISIIALLTGLKISLFIYKSIIVYILTIVWLVGITNAFNLLDNTDGLTSGVAFIASIMFGVVNMQQGNYSMAILCMILAGSILGFLRFNFHPAKIFLGDAGSYFLGFTLAAIAISTTYVEKSFLKHLPTITPLFILAVPIFDTLSVITIRIIQKRPIFVGDKSHFSHRLMNLGLSIKFSVLTIYLVSITVALPGLLLTKVSREDALLLLFHTLCIFAIIIILEYTGVRLIKQNGKNN